MANTYNLISSVTVGSGGAASIDFTSIPGTYTDLVLRLSLRATVAATDQTVTLKFNNSSAAVYKSIRLYGDGSASTSSGDAASSTSINLYSSVASTATASTFGNAEIYIFNYAGSANKTAIGNLVTEQNATRGITSTSALYWGDTAAITQVTFTVPSTTFVQNSTAYLYGIKNS